MIIFDNRFKDVQRGFLVRLKDAGDTLFLALQFRKGQYTFFDLDTCTVVTIPTLANVSEIVSDAKGYELSVFSDRVVPFSRAIANGSKATKFVVGSLYSSENYLFLYLSKDLGFFNFTTLNVVEPLSSLTYVASFDELVITLH